MRHRLMQLLHLFIIVPLLAFASVNAARAQDSTSSALQLLLMGKGLHVNDWGTQTSNNLLKLEAAIAGRTDITLGSLDYTLSDTEARSAYIVAAGTLSNDVNVIVPARAHSWMFYNNASAHNVIIKLAAGGSSVTLTPANRGYLIWTDGATGVYQLTDPAGIATASGNASAALTLANAALPKAGGTMTGAINLGGFTLSNGGAPSATTDLTTKTYVDTAISTGVGSIQAIPAGMIAAFNTASCPTGWAETNGSAYGLDLRGYFVRAWDHGRGVDTGRGQGSTQADAVQDHTHSIASALQAGFGFGFTGNSGSTGASITATGSMASGNAASETRVKNVALLHCAKL
jgi:hypothetical protein